MSVCLGSTFGSQGCVLGFFYFIFYTFMKTYPKGKWQETVTGIFSYTNQHCGTSSPLRLLNLVFSYQYLVKFPLKLIFHSGSERSKNKSLASSKISKVEFLISYVCVPSCLLSFNSLCAFSFLCFNVFDLIYFKTI